MYWHDSGRTHTAQQGEYQLRVWLDPNMPIPTDDDDLGSDEHPFVWLFEGRYQDGTVDFRGVRETLEEAKQAAAYKLAQLEPEVYSVAEGF